MNSQQQLWWEQARSDFEVFEHLQSQSFDACHQLHYLQMATEKLGKAYFWREGHAPPTSHAAFVRFLQLLDTRKHRDRERIATRLGFSSGDQFETWLRSIAPLAHDIQKLAPALAGFDGPNVEYPWPTDDPVNAPCRYSFPVAADLQSSRGRQFCRVLKSVFQEFSKFA